MASIINTTRLSEKNKNHLWNEKDQEEKEGVVNIVYMSLVYNT